MSSVRYIALAIGIIAALVVIAIIAVLALTYYVRKRRARQFKKVRLLSQYSYITPLDPPPFVIPPYACDDDTIDDSFDVSSLSSMSTITDDKPKDECESPVNLSPMGTPTITRPQFDRSVSEIESAYNRERSRPKYRRTVSTLGGSLAHHPVKRKTSVTPYGKIQVSIQYVTSKSLLVVQVNGMYDLPQLRTSGVSTPYVRVNLISGDDDKDMRTNFMNLSSNRICVFDRISLDKAKESTLKFVILDYDKFSRSEFVAQITVPLSEISLEEGETVMRKLISQPVPEVNLKLGTLTVSLCQEPSAGRLVVTVIKAEGLPSNKSEDILNSYVRVSYCVQKKVVDKRKTKIVKRTTHPVFNEPLVFQMKEEELKHSCVICEVIESDFKLTTEKLGFINLGTNSFGSEIRHWDEMMSSPQKQIVHCHNLHL